jgi:hypothetical protein
MGGGVQGGGVAMLATFCMIVGASLASGVVFAGHERCVGACTFLPADPDGPDP